MHPPIQLDLPLQTIMVYILVGLNLRTILRGMLVLELLFHKKKLHLSGIGTQSIRVDTDGTALSIYNHSEFIGFIGNDAGKLFINAGGTEDTLSLRTNGIEKLRITSAGHIGIGTDNPTFDLHLFRTGDTTFVIESDRPNSDENANPKLVFRQDGGVSASAIGMNFDSDNVGNDLFIANSIASGSIRFLTGSNNGYTNASEALRITSDGNIGIGTTNPDSVVSNANSSILHVGIITARKIFGDANITGTIDSARNVEINDDTTNSGTHYIHFGSETAGNDQVEVDSNGLVYKDGKVGIGTDSPTGKLQVGSATGSHVIITENTGVDINDGAINLYQATSNVNAPPFIISTDVGGTETEKLRVTGAGNVGINSTVPTEKLDVIGTVKATDFNTTSDQNLKTNVRTIENSIEKITEIRGVNFEWKDNNKPSAGVIAQEVEKVLPELIGGEKTKTVNYNGLIGLLIEVVKEQQTQINSLNQRLSKLE